jgi:hypothetical protein
VTGADKRQLVLDIYTELLQTIWARTSLIVGTTTVSTLLETALFEATPQHPFLESLRVSPEGLDLSAVPAHLEKVSAEEVCAGFEDLISGLYAAFTILTGDVILRQIDPHLKHLREQLKGV